MVPKKGGTDKTTLSLATACAAAMDGLSTVVVDLDPLATASVGGIGAVRNASNRWGRSSSC